MIDKRFLEDLSQQISRLLPQAEAAGEDIKKTVSSALQKGFARLDLLTREEFEAQQAVLTRAQNRVTELETEIAMLEARLRELEKNHEPH